MQHASGMRNKYNILIGKRYGKGTGDNAFRSYIWNCVMWCIMNWWQAMVNTVMNSYIV